MTDWSRGPPTSGIRSRPWLGYHRDMTSQPGNRRTTPFITWLVCIFFLGVFYLASLGPFVWLWESSRIADESGTRIYETVYFPVYWLEANTDFFADYAIGRAYVWYVELWMPDFDEGADPWVASPI
jgi:hypothetical protein